MCRCAVGRRIAALQTENDGLKKPKGAIESEDAIPHDMLKQIIERTSELINEEEEGAHKQAPDHKPAANTPNMTDKGHRWHRNGMWPHKPNQAGPAA